MASAAANVFAPVHVLKGDVQFKPYQKGVALCLSGGGYRAMLFHLGSIIRLNELGTLSKVRRVSSVSGGSIVAAQLGLQWQKLNWENGKATNLEQLVVNPIRELAGKTLDSNWKTVLAELGAVGLGTTDEVIKIFKKLFKSESKSSFFSNHFPIGAGVQVSKLYQELLFQGATLQDLPDQPSFFINATNLQTGNLWIFSKAKMGDSKIGFIASPTVKLADAVAASSAFPPVLSPFILKLNGDEVWQPGGTHIEELGVEHETFGEQYDESLVDEMDEELDKELKSTEFKKRIFLTDGGAYDNLGIETSWKRFYKILISDGGAHISTQISPATELVFQGIRVADVMNAQVRMLRKRQVIGSLKLTKSRVGAYWSIRGELTEKSDAQPLNPKLLQCPLDQVHRLAHEPTRLRAMQPQIIDWLINWGYAKCDGIVRGYASEFVDANPPNPIFPSKNQGIGA